MLPFATAARASDRFMNISGPAVQVFVSVRKISHYCLAVFVSTTRFWADFSRIFGRTLRLWTRFVSLQNDPWCSNFSEIESKHFSAECNFPFSDFAPRKDSGTNSAKIALSRWIHYLAPVFILNFHFLRGLEQIWYHIRNQHTLAVPNMVSELNLMLSSASGDVEKHEKRVIFRVIFGNRLSSAA